MQIARSSQTSFAAEPSRGVRTLAAVLIVVGLASMLTNGAAIGLGRALIGVQTALAIAYGITAIAAGDLLWRRSAGACRAYLAWCGTLCAYLMTMPELFVWYLLPGFLLAALVLVWGYRYISQNVASGR